MSAPVRDREKERAAGTVTAPPRKDPRRGTAAPDIPEQRSGRVGEGSAKRAHTRRDERLRRLVGGPRPDGSIPVGRPQFVLLVMVLLATGLVATLGLSTAAAADSYALQAARDRATELGEQTERLRQQVSEMQSPPEIARRAQEMGMVRAEDTARLVVGADGSVTVVGEPRTAQAPVAPIDPAALTPGTVAPGTGTTPPVAGTTGDAPATPVLPGEEVPPAGEPADGTAPVEAGGGTTGTGTATDGTATDGTATDGTATDGAAGAGTEDPA